MKFEEDAYLRGLTTKVVDTFSDYVILEDTIFHPQSGGQPADKGTINGIIVKDVKKEEGRIKHYIDTSTFKKGMAVKLELDWNYRYYLMKAHTAEHLFYACLSKQSKVTVEKINLEFNNSSLFIRGEVSFDQLIKAQKLLMEEIRKKLPVATEMHNSEEELAGVRIKRDKIRDEKIRVVKIGEFDLAACTGTHVKNTSEIGFFALTGFKSEGKDVYEISFEIGEEAENKTIEQSARLLQISYETRIVPQNLIVSVKNALSERDELRSRLRGITEDYLKNKVWSVESGLIIEQFNGLDNEKLIKTASDLAAEKKCSVIILNSSNLIVAGINAEKLFFEITKELDGKGGGRSDLKIGRINNPDINKIRKIALK